MELSRRNFLVGASAAGVMGVMGLAGCAPQAKSEPAEATGNGELSSTGAGAARPDFYMCDED